MPHMSPVRGIAASLAVAVVATGCATARTGSIPAIAGPEPAAAPEPTSGSGDAATGVLVMAHGGSEAWNASVRAAVAPIASERPTRIAFGMADPKRLQMAVDELEADGARRIAVVRLFISGESFLHRTEFLLGKRPDPPAVSAMHGAGEALAPLDISSDIELDRQGLIDGSEVADIVRARARALSRDPGEEVVLMIGHGNGDESANGRILEGMEAAAAGVRAEGFGEVRVETLREDWPEKREAAERRIRAWVADRCADGYRVLVVPFRLSGFGPYAAVLEGLEYEADGLGLLPHPAITEWIRGRADTLLGGAVERDR